MSKHESNPKRDPLDENVDELLSQMAAGKVITDEGAVSVEEIEARKPKASFTGTELLDDGNPVPKKGEPTPIAHDAPLADDADEPGATTAAPATHEASDTSSVKSFEDRGNTGEDPTSTPENNLGQIPVDSVNSAESAVDEAGPDAAADDASDGTEPSDVEAVVAPASVAGSKEAGEPVPELADQLDSLLSGADAAGPGAGEELAVESLEMEATESDSVGGNDAGGTIESLNAELEAAAAKVGSGAGEVEAPGAQPEVEQAVVGQVEAETAGVEERAPAAEAVAATQDAIPSKVQPHAPSATPEALKARAAEVPATTAAPVAVEPKGPSALTKLKDTVGAAAGSAALSALALASSPLKNASRSTRDTIGWVGLWTAFLGVCVWFYVLVLHKAAPAFVPAAAIHVVENAEEGGEGGEKKPAKKEGVQEKAAAKPAAKSASKSGENEAPGGGKAKPASKPASKPAAKSGGD